MLSTVTAVADFSSGSKLQSLCGLCQSHTDGGCGTGATCFRFAVFSSLSGKTSGGYCVGVPPLSIPNREVKPVCADGTAMQCGRVGGRLLLYKRDCRPDRGNAVSLFLFLTFRVLHRRRQPIQGHHYLSVFEY